MTVRVQAPNGEIVEFPDGTSDETMARAMRQTYGGPSPQRQRAAGQDMASRAGFRQALRTASPVGVISQPIADTLLDPTRRAELGRSLSGAARSVVDYWRHPPSMQQWLQQTGRGLNEGAQNIPANVVNILSHPLQTLNDWTVGPFANEEQHQREIDYSRALGDNASLPALAQQANADTGAALLNAGGAATMGLGTAARAGAGLRGLMGQMGRGAASGAAYGGVTGYALTPGGPEERAAGAAEGAGTGAVLGGITPPIVNTAGAGIRTGARVGAAIARNLPHVEPVGRSSTAFGMGPMRVVRGGGRGPNGERLTAAQASVVDRLSQRNRMSAADVAQALEAARSNPQGEVLADIFGDPGVRTARSIVQAPGEAGAASQATARARFSEMPSRLMRGLREGFGVGQTRAQAMAKLSNEYDRASVENYRPTLDQPTTPDMVQAMHNNIGDMVLEDPLMRRALKRGRSIFDRERRAGWVSGNLDESVPRMLHYLKIGLDAEITAARRNPTGLQAQEMPGVIAMRNRVRDTLFEHVPGYREAASRWGSAATAEDALNRGADFVSMTPDQVQPEWEAMTPFEREHARIGLVDEIQNETRGGVNRNVNVARKLDDPNIQSVIRLMFDDPHEAANYLEGTVNKQYQLGENASQWRGGSQTYGNMAHGEDNEAAAHALGHAATGNVPGAVMAGARHAANVFTAGHLERHNNELSHVLFRRVDGPSAQSFANAIVAELRRRERIRATNATASAVTGRQAAVRRKARK